MAPSVINRRRFRRSNRARNDIQMVSYRPRNGVPYRRPVPNIYRFKRMASPNVIIETGSNTSFSRTGAVSFNLADLPNNGDFLSMFQQYQITGIRYRWVIDRTPNLSGITNNTTVFRGSYPFVNWFVDNDSTSVPTSNEIAQAQNIQQYVFTDDKPRSPWYYMRPCSLAMLYDGLTIAYSPTWNKWIPTNYNSVPHYGLKYEVSPLGQDIKMSLECMFYFKLRAPI